MLTWRPQAVDGEGEKVGTDLRVLAQVIQRPRGIFAAWLENAMAALVLRQEQIPADGEVAQVHLGPPKLEFAVARPSGISKM